MAASQGPFVAALWQGLGDASSRLNLPILLAAVGLCFLAYASGLAVYRLFLSPIAGIPGPKLAAATFWYEIYYDVWLGGRYHTKIAEMHKIYGPVVRINPYELHFNDPDFIDSIFPGPARKTNKFYFTGQRTGTQNSIVATIDHDVHRRRRAAISAFFSNASIRRLEPLMQQHLAKLLARLDAAGRPGGGVVPMHYLFRAATSDLITAYAFGDSFHFLDREDLAMPYMQSTNFFSMLNHAFCHFPWLGALLASTPPWAVKALMPSLAEMWDKQLMWIEKVQQLRHSKGPAGPGQDKNTIFQGILASKSIPDEEKTNARLAHEAQLIVFAGEDTTAHTLQAALYELLANPAEFAKLKAEVVSAAPDADQAPTFAQIENLPYLNAVIQETIRIHPGVVSRLPRVSPQAAIVYSDKQRGKEYVIPPGTSTNMTIQIAHMNEDVFPDPYEFRPQRWLDNPRIDRAFIGFARGTRNCIGMTLARRELALFLAAIVRKYDIYDENEAQGPTLELWRTTRARDIDLAHDYILPFPTKGSHGLRVKVRS